MSADQAVVASVGGAWRHSLLARDETGPRRPGGETMSGDAQERRPEWRACQLPPPRAPSSDEAIPWHSPRGSLGAHLRRYRTRHGRDKRPTRGSVRQSSMPYASRSLSKISYLGLETGWAPSWFRLRRMAQARGDSPSEPRERSPCSQGMGQNIEKGAS